MTEGGVAVGLNHAIKQIPRAGWLFFLQPSCSSTQNRWSAIQHVAAGTSLEEPGHDV